MAQNGALLKFLAVALLVCSWMHVAAGRASAECFGETDPWPSFRAAVPTAQRIISGQVLRPESASDPTGYLAAFRLRVIDVLRGPVPDGGVLRIVGLRSGLPLTVCSDSVAMLLPGDVVVFAFDALGPDGTTRINTLAYLHKAGDSVLSNVETITAAELERIAATAAPSGPAPPVGVLLVAAAVLLLTLFGAAVFLRGFLRGLLALVALCLLLTGCDFAIGDAGGDRRQVRLELVVRNESRESFQLEVRPIENGEVAGGGWHRVQRCSIGSGFQEISSTWFLYLWPDRAWEGDEGTEIYSSAHVNEQEALTQLRVEIDQNGAIAVRPGRLRPNEPPGGELDNC